MKNSKLLTCRATLTTVLLIIASIHTTYSVLKKPQSSATDLFDTIVKNGNTSGCDRLTAKNINQSDHYWNQRYIISTTDDVITSGNRRKKRTPSASASYPISVKKDMSRGRYFSRPRFAPRNSGSSSRTTKCINATGMARAVYESDAVFAGKILDLTPLPAVINAEKEKNADDLYYYYYRASKKRRRENRRHPGFVNRPKRFRRNLKSSFRSGFGSKQPDYKTRVRVKTVFKGKQRLESRVLVVLIKAMEKGRCFSRIKAGDTRIFFYKDIPSAVRITRSRLARSGTVSENVGVNLNDLDFMNQTIMPLPPRLQVFNVVRAAVKGKHRNFF